MNDIDSSVVAEKPKTRTQKFIVLLAYASYIGAVICVVLLYLHPSDGVFDAVAASLSASFVFFGGMGIVLHVIGKTNLPDLRITGGSD